MFNEKRDPRFKSFIWVSTRETLYSGLVSVAAETGLSLTFSETPKTGFIASRPNFYSQVLPRNTGFHIATDSKFVNPILNNKLYLLFFEKRYIQIIYRVFAIL